jgi:hypothetical protein
MAYSGQAEQIFQSALVSAFPTYEALDQFVRLLDLNLAEISRRGNLRDVAFDVVRWADRENRVPELVEKAAGEQPGNPKLQQALRHVRDPLLVEDRWFARQVPIATWLLGVANVALLLLVVKVFLANLINTVRVLSTLALALFVALAGWYLYNWLVVGAVRARVRTRIRRLVAHSRLERHDWLAFAGMLGLVVLQATAAARAPEPVVLSFDREPAGAFWKDAEFVLVRSFPNIPSEMELQGPERAGLRHPERFSKSYYRADLFIGGRNLARRLKVQIDLSPSVADTTGAELSAGPPGVTFADIAVDRALGDVVADEQQVLRESKGRITETSVEFVVDLDEISGLRTVLFTCQRRLDGQPTPKEVSVYARILDDKGAVLYRTSRTFSIADWRDEQAVATGSGAGAARGRSARRPAAGLGVLGALPGVRLNRVEPARSAALR